MSTVRPGNRSTLVVVDVQVGVMADCWDAPKVVQRVAHAVGHQGAKRCAHQAVLGGHGCGDRHCHHGAEQRSAERA